MATTDWYRQLTSHPLGRQMTSRMGLPAAVRLRRYDPSQPLAHGPALLGAAPGGRLRTPAHEHLERVEVDVRTALEGDQSYAALVFDASGVVDCSQLRELHAFFRPAVRRLKPSGRVLVLASVPEEADGAREFTAQRALEGFIRSVGKELRAGSTANLIRVAGDAEDGLSSTLEFFVSGRSAFVSGQVVTLSAAGAAPLVPPRRLRPLDGKVAVVTGAGRGIGASTAEVLARDGAHVICLDIPAQGQALTEIANRVNGSALQLDITAREAPRRLAEHAQERHGGLDIVVHNAGITRDKTLAGMGEDTWNHVLEVNLCAQQRLNDVLLGEAVLRERGRIVCLSSLTGIAGQRGQTNYTTSKAGVIGLVQALAPELARRDSTVNAVAPGFIETSMTERMPFALRELGRRLNSLNQGGLPVDVAETIAWLAHPESTRINGQVVRVCGQSLLGA